jgi:hypothetical protein
MQYTLTIIAFLVGTLMCGCSQTEIAAGSYGQKAEEAKPKKKKKSEGLDFDNTKESIDSDDEEDEEDDSDFIYPRFFFAGKGSSSCEGENYAQTTKVETELDANELAVNTTHAEMHCKSECKKKADANLKKTAVGITTYERTTKSDLDRLIKDDDFEYHSFLIYADSVTKNNGNIYTFETPIPVFPMPQAQSRFKKFTSATYTTMATFAQDRFPVTITIRKTSDGNGIIRLESTLDINDPNWTIYEHFPIPASSKYVIDTEDKNILSIDSHHKWHGDKNCDGNKETTDLAYSLCKKSKEGVETPFSTCTY